MVNCIDLKERFGHRFRIRYEDNGERRRGGDPWLAMIDCRHGHIFPWGGPRLAASTNTRGPVARRLAALPCVQVVQDADDGINATFHADDFPTIAAVMKPKRRRTLSAGHRAKLAEAGRLALGRYRNSGDDSKPRRRDPAAQTTLGKSDG